MNITFGLLRAPELQCIADKQRKKELLVSNALTAARAFAVEIEQIQSTIPVVL